MDPIGIDKAVEELSAKTLPELLAMGNALVDRFEKLLERLDGASITLRLSPNK